jgi:hypothetical protein
MKSPSRWLLTLAFLAGAVAPVWAGAFDDDEGGDGPVRFSGLLDGRYARTSQQRSWLQRGPNKLRYGGADIDNNGSGDRASNIFAVPQVSLVIDADVPADAEVHIQLNLDADADSGNGSAGLIEAFGRRAWDVGENNLFLKAGAFFPPISWEHPENAWSTRYTLTPSAIGSWVGMEVRAFGVEGVWKRAVGEHSAQVTAAAFSGGDQTGWVLLEWGWTLHDYQAHLNEQLPLPNNRSERPFKELDGRMGGYGRLDFSFFSDLLKIGGGYFDNNGEFGGVSNQNNAGMGIWNTQFWDVGAKLDWRGITLLAQLLRGETASRSQSRRDYDAFYVLGSTRLGKWRFSGRWDDFWVRGWEDGYALTGAMHYSLSVRQTLTAEYILARARPSLAVRPASTQDEIFQLNYRFRWGG